MSDLPIDPRQSENLKQLIDLPCKASIPTSLSSAQESLRPATAAAGSAELAACLTLVAPSGMSAEDRDSWLKVARATLSGMPADLLAVGCKEARKRCRFASEIVPTILEYVENAWESRKRFLEAERAQYANRHAPRIEQKPPEYVSANVMRDLIKSLSADRLA